MGGECGLTNKSILAWEHFNIIQCEYNLVSIAYFAQFFVLLMISQYISQYIVPRMRKPEQSGDSREYLQVIDNFTHLRSVMS